MRTCNWLSFLKHKQIRFLTSSVIVTSADYIVFFLLLVHVGPVISNILSYCVAICISFYIQKKYVFKISRHEHVAFVYVITFSLLAIAVSTGALSILNHMFSNVLIAKVIVTIIMFFYNYHTKRIAFGDTIKRQANPK